jgi:hypothetical protein
MQASEKIKVASNVKHKNLREPIAYYYYSKIAELKISCKNINL